MVAVAAEPKGATPSTRVIVKNIPKWANEARLREHFASAGEVTDCKIQKTKDGQSRQFAFVGFRSSGNAESAVKQLNKSFFDTCRLSVELAFAPGSEGLARPWSRYTPGSTAHKKRNPELYQEGQAEANKSKAKSSVKADKASGPPSAEPVVVSSPAAPARDEEEELTQEHPSEAAKADDGEVAPASRSAAAFNDELSDLAYLKTKTASARTEEENDLAEREGDTVAKSAAPEAKDEASSGKKAKKKKVVKKRKAAAEEVVAEPAAAEATAQEETAEKGPAGEDGQALDDLDSGRLYVTNIPYGTTEDELRGHFEPLGEVSGVHICKDEDTLKSRGFAYVAYLFPECAARAIAELDMQSFQGRLLRIAPAQARPQPAETDEGAEKTKGRTSSFKRKQAEKRKKVDAHLEHTWNLLYVSANAAADVAAAQLGVSKSALFGKDAENSAVTAALTETSLIQQTKRWLQKEGIRVDAFEQSGTNLMTSKAVASDANAKRRDDTFIVKHLPAEASSQELQERFRRYGELTRCSMAPSGTVALVQYADKSNAQFAFQKLAFSRYRHVPLYLEWAPEDVFVANAQSGAQTNANDDNEEGEQQPEATGVGEDEDADAQASRGCLFVKNLSFSTTDEALKSAFAGCKGLRAATIMRKKAAVKKGAASGQDSNSNLSMGYGFLEFATKEQALECMKRRQSTVVDGHSLQLQVSQRHAGSAEAGRSGAVSKKKKVGALPSTRLCVRNLAFEATSRELRQLFSAYGAVTALRIPKKADYTGHRGFAFIDFASKAEAAAAFEALQHTHLYGRRLVIEPAEERQSDVMTVAEETQKRQVSKALRSEATKRRRTGVLDTSGEGRGFEEMLM